MRASPATVPDSEGAVNPREQALAQSKLEGNLLLSEIKLKQLKAERLKAADEKEALQREYNSLLEEKQALEKDHLRAEHERLKVAKALIDIEVEGNAQTATLEAQVAELKSQLGSKGANKWLQDATDEVAHRIKTEHDLEDGHGRPSCSRAMSSPLMAHAAPAGGSPHGAGVFPSDGPINVRRAASN